jgi:hypothetical protein
MSAKSVNTESLQGKDGAGIVADLGFAPASPAVAG